VFDQNESRVNNRSRVKIRRTSLIIEINKENPLTGGLAQLARAPALHAGGQRFESVILHQKGVDRGQRNCIPR